MELPGVVESQGLLDEYDGDDGISKTAVAATCMSDITGCFYPNLYRNHASNVTHGAKPVGEMSFESILHRWIVAYKLQRVLTTAEQVDHLCRQRACWNFGHLELVSGAENNKRQKNAVELEARLRFGQILHDLALVHLFGEHALQGLLVVSTAEGPYQIDPESGTAQLLLDPALAHLRPPGNKKYRPKAAAIAGDEWSLFGTEQALGTDTVEHGDQIIGQHSTLF